jgi:hypothetical protein
LHGGRRGLCIDIDIGIGIGIRVGRRILVALLLLLLFVLAFRRGSARPARPVVFGRGGLADGLDGVVADAPPVFAAGGAFAVGPAVRLVARVVHPYDAVGPGTRVPTREDLMWRFSEAKILSFL